MKGFLWYAGAVAVIVVLAGAFFYVKPELLRPDASAVVECAIDSDCVPAGCSNQVCAPAEKAPTIITTCEFREEWSCLAKTSCGCVKNKCAWEDNAEYTQCMEKFRG